MEPRLAKLTDVAMIARLHMQAWHETYTGLLPQSIVDQRDFAQRHDLWAQVIETDLSRVVVIDDVGFAQVGPQRGPQHIAEAYPQELYALYVVKSAYGTGAGRILMSAALGTYPDPFSVLVLAANRRAVAFYEKMGGRLLGYCDDPDSDAQLTYLMYGWDRPKTAAEELTPPLIHSQVGQWNTKRP